MRQIFFQLGLICLLTNQAANAESTILQKGPFTSKDGLSIFVRAEGPATRETPLQAACFFEHQASGDLLSGGTETFNEKIGGLIKKLRDNGDFKGNELETLVILPPLATVPAKKILLIGLGDPMTFSAERMKKVGSVAVREAFKAGVDKLSFSPNVTDAGAKTVPVQEFDQKFIEGVLEAYKIQKELNKQKLVPDVTLTEFTLEAGELNVPSAAKAVEAAIKATN
jgi:hypothetical protein